MMSSHGGRQGDGKRDSDRRRPLHVPNPARSTATGMTNWPDDNLDPHTSDRSYRGNSNAVRPLPQRSVTGPPKWTLQTPGQTKDHLSDLTQQQQHLTPASDYPLASHGTTQ